MSERKTDRRTERKARGVGGCAAAVLCPPSPRFLSFAEKHGSLHSLSPFPLSFQWR